MDEPLSNLDAQLRVATRAELIKLHQRLQTTVVYVTHDQTEAMTMGSRIAVMRDGLLQQLDSPQELYDHPTNMFVAGFIGSPSMNFFEATLRGTAEALYVDTGTFSVRVPATLAPGLSQYLGREIYFGVRPEDIYERALLPDAAADSTLSAQVNVVEPLGSEQFVYLMCGNNEFVARMDPHRTILAGQQIELALDLIRMHLFDRTTQTALV